MNERKHAYAERGMILGLIFGSAAATVMFVTTGEVFYFGLIGVGMALGLGLGTALEGRDDAS